MKPAILDLPSVCGYVALSESTVFNNRMRKLCYSPTRICNSSMPRHDHYTTGFGEVIQPVRPGADDHMAHPSLFIGRRSWRDGRVEVA